eukprot:234493-Karenia_brevis.AAC.1
METSILNWNTHCCGGSRCCIKEWRNVNNGKSRLCRVYTYFVMRQAVIIKWEQFCFVMKRCIIHR